MTYANPRNTSSSSPPPSHPPGSHPPSAVLSGPIMGVRHEVAVKCIKPAIQSLIESFLKTQKGSCTQADLKKTADLQRFYSKKLSLVFDTALKDGMKDWEMHIANKSLKVIATLRRFKDASLDRLHAIDTRFVKTAENARHSAAEDLRGVLGDAQQEKNKALANLDKAFATLTDQSTLPPHARTDLLQAEAACKAKYEQQFQRIAHRLSKQYDAKLKRAKEDLHKEAEYLSSEKAMVSTGIDACSKSALQSFASIVQECEAAVDMVDSESGKEALKSALKDVSYKIESIHSNLRERFRQPIVAEVQETALKQQEKSIETTLEDLTVDFPTLPSTYDKASIPLSEAFCEKEFRHLADQNDTILQKLGDKYQPLLNRIDMLADEIYTVKSKAAADSFRRKFADLIQRIVRTLECEEEVVNRVLLHLRSSDCACSDVGVRRALLTEHRYWTKYRALYEAEATARAGEKAVLANEWKLLSEEFGRSP